MAILIPFFFELSRSILSNPTPCLEINFNLSALSKISEVIFEVLSDIASQSFIFCFIFSGLISSTISYS